MWKIILSVFVVGIRTDNSLISLVQVFSHNHWTGPKKAIMAKININF